MNRAIPLASIDLSKCGPQSPLHALAKKRTRGPSKQLERKAQTALIAWATDNTQRYPALAWLFAVPNWFGIRTEIQGARAKAEGRKKGVPDLLLPVARGPYVGLAIEMKSPGRSPTGEQKVWLNHFKAQGWLTDVCFTFEEARDTLLAYLSGKESTAESPAGSR